MATSFCSACKTLKSVDDNFNISPKDGKPYPTCKLCHHAESVTFWSDPKKKFRHCKSCDTTLPLRKFDGVDGVPYPKCRSCYEAAYAKKSAEKRAQSKLVVEQPTSAIPAPVTQSAPLPAVQTTVGATAATARSWGGGGGGAGKFTYWRK